MAIWAAGAAPDGAPSDTIFPSFVVSHFPVGLISLYLRSAPPFFWAELFGRVRLCSIGGRFVADWVSAAGKGTVGTTSGGGTTATNIRVTVSDRAQTWVPTAAPTA